MVVTTPHLVDASSHVRARAQRANEAQPTPGTRVSYHVSCRPAMELISEGDTVLIQRDKTYRTFVLKKGRWVCLRMTDCHIYSRSPSSTIRKLNLEKLSFYPDKALGLRYGSSFQVERHQLVHSTGRRSVGGVS